jgi:vacuolar-type H+-ATPase subunit D/Vma8
MGVRFPATAECELPERPPDQPIPDGAALIGAEARYRLAVPAAARAAVERAAVRGLEAAVATTRRQVRALRRHWIPLLGTALAGVDAALEQADHEDAVRRAVWVRPGRSTLPGLAEQAEAGGEGGDGP